MFLPGSSSDLCGVHGILTYINIFFLGLVFFGVGRGRSVKGFRKSVELHVLGLWWGVRPCGMSRTAKSAGVMLENCVVRKKPGEY